MQGLMRAAGVGAAMLIVGAQCLVSPTTMQAELANKTNYSRHHHHHRHRHQGTNNNEK